MYIYIHVFILLINIVPDLKEMKKMFQAKFL